MPARELARDHRGALLGQKKVVALDPRPDLLRLVALRHEPDIVPVRPIVDVDPAPHRRPGIPAIEDTPGRLLDLPGARKEPPGAARLLEPIEMPRHIEPKQTGEHYSTTSGVSAAGAVPSSRSASSTS